MSPCLKFPLANLNFSMCVFLFFLLPQLWGWKEVNHLTTLAPWIIDHSSDQVFKSILLLNWFLFDLLRLKFDWVLIRFKINRHSQLKDAQVFKLNFWFEVQSNFQTLRCQLFEEGWNSIANFHAQNCWFIILKVSLRFEIVRMNYRLEKSPPLFVILLVFHIFNFRVRVAN